MAGGEAGQSSTAGTYTYYYRCGQETIQRYTGRYQDVEVIMRDIEIPQKTSKKVNSKILRKYQFQRHEANKYQLRCTVKCWKNPPFRVFNVLFLSFT